MTMKTAVNIAAEASHNMPIVRKALARADQLD
jgi:hypothetical protein